MFPSPLTSPPPARTTQPDCYSPNFSVYAQQNYAQQNWTSRTYSTTGHHRRRPTRTRRVVWLLVLASTLALLTFTFTRSTLMRSTADSGTAPDRVGLSTAAFEAQNISEHTGSLTAELARRLRLAQTAAARDGITITVTSGWRSLDKQRELYRAEIETYGSAEVAQQWVLPPDESEHPKGRAIYIGPEQAGVWLNAHGYKYGLCRPYANEWWHFEPRVLPGQQCPPIVKNAADHRPASKAEIVPPGPR